MRFLAALGLSLALSAPAPALGSRQAVEPADMMAPPAAGGKPVAVAVGFYVMDFARLTARDESYDATAYLEVSWHDPRLAAPGRNSKRPRPVDTAKVWTPRVFLNNTLEPTRYLDGPITEVDDSGLVTSWSVVAGKFSAAMDLRAFPFDAQTLSAQVGSVENADAVEFTVKPELVQVGPEAFVTDWTLGKAWATVDTHRYVAGQEAYPRLTYSVRVTRRSTFYVWRVLVPLTLLALVSWASFWFEPVNLQPQISTCMSALISLVAFNFAIDFSLPKVAYLTMIDKHALIGFAFVAWSVAGVTWIHTEVTAKRLERALAIQRAYRRLFLPAYGLAVAVNLSGVFR